jgi:hypothetical protein
MTIKKGNRAAEIQPPVFIGVPECLYRSSIFLPAFKLSKLRIVFSTSE